MFDLAYEVLVTARSITTKLEVALKPERYKPRASCVERSLERLGDDSLRSCAHFVSRIHDPSFW